MASELSAYDRKVVDAFKLVLELAEQNALDCEPDLEDEYKRQQEALQIVQEVIMLNEQAEPAVIVAGSWPAGFRVIGPFVNWEAAAEHVFASQGLGASTWVTTCESPEEDAG